MKTVLHSARLVSNIQSIFQRTKYALLVVIASGCYAGILFNQIAPYAEGWYTYYAQCINSGNLPYKDFDYLFPPLYIYLIAFITKLFGYKLIVLRFFGIIIFSVISLLVFLIIKEIFNEKIALISAITSSLYLQSEVVQIFYDYIRVMDIFSLLTILFLIKAIKNRSENKISIFYLSFAGFSNSLFALVKQNMGLLFFAYVILFLFVSENILHTDFKKILHKLMSFITSFFIPVLITCCIMIANGSMSYFLSQTGSSAIAAKGGLLAIIFNWYINNLSTFKSCIPFSLLYIIILVLVTLIKKRSDNNYTLNEKFFSTTTILYAVICTLLVIVCAKNQAFALVLDNEHYLSPYCVFLMVIPIFLFFASKVIYKSATQQNIEIIDILYVAVTGSYFAIAWGCGMSGGLSEGQSGVGLAFAIAILINNCNFKYGDVAKCVVIVFCCLLSMQCAVKKFSHTYNWWGMDESNLWESKYTSPDINVLQGIGMSSETLNAYETIYHIVTENTTADDSIYCFPQIPIFYTICDRKDPGVRAKVQWFDVASDSSIEEDIDIIANNPPGAVLIYDTSEYAYNSHERLFRKGDISATRRMKQFLLNFVTQNNYTFYGRITSTNNNGILVYCKTTSDEDGAQYHLTGDGTQESPFKINSVADLCFLQNSVANGNDYANTYFLQTTDLDLSCIDNWIPIGIDGSTYYFNGIYNGNGHVIKNMTCNASQSPNAGLFGTLGGIVCNLGLVDSVISGDYTGAIAINASNENAMIINCYTKSSVYGIRAGGITDDFIGRIINCVSLSNCNGLTSAGAISYTNGYVDNVFSNYTLLNTELLNANFG